eukprot:352454-Chlamydomonas_euryale.AAC.4
MMLQKPSRKAEARQPPVSCPVTQRPFTAFLVACTGASAADGLLLTRLRYAFHTSPAALT